MLTAANVVAVDCSKQEQTKPDGLVNWTNSNTHMTRDIRPAGTRWPFFGVAPRQ